MTAVKIDNWRIVPVENGEVALMGDYKGCVGGQTTCIIEAMVGFVKTESGTIYELGVKSPGMWELQLQLKRPAKHANLAKKGIVG